MIVAGHIILGELSNSQNQSGRKTVLRSIQWLRNLFPVWMSLQWFNHTLRFKWPLNWFYAFPTLVTVSFLCVFFSSVADWLKVCPQKVRGKCLTPRVGQLMFPQAWQPGKSQPTLVTCVWFNSTVEESMPFQDAHLIESLPTLLTRVWSEPTVDDSMSF